MTTPTSLRAIVLQSFAVAGFALAAVACGASTEAADDGSGQSFGSGAAITARACASDGDCFGGTCIFQGEGEFRAGTCEGGNPPAPSSEGDGQSTTDKDGTEGGGAQKSSCSRVCTSGQLDPNRPYDDVITVSNATVTSGGHGSWRVKVVGDNNVITTEGAGSTIFDVYGSGNRIFEPYSGGGSNVVNILSGTNNTADFTTLGGCNAVNFVHGKLTVKNHSCGGLGNGVNGQPAESKVYTLP